MFGHRAIHLSSWTGTKRDLTFFRNVPAIRPDTGEELVNFRAVLTLKNIDVQPVSNTSLLNTKLAQTYAQMYIVTVNGDAAVQALDRTIIDGAECVVIGPPHRWGGHTEIEIGAREPTAGGNVLANQQTPGA